MKKYLKNWNTYLLVISAVLTCFGFPPAVILVLYAGWRLGRKEVEKLNSLLYGGLAMIVMALFMMIPMGTYMITEGHYSTFGVLLAIYGVAFLGGIGLIAMYLRFSQEDRLMRRCFWLVRTEHITSLERLGEILGLSKEKMKALLNRMFTNGRLQGASLSEDEKEIRFERSIWARQLVVCENCGAEFTVDLGHTLVCDYCGRALKVRRKWE